MLKIDISSQHLSLKTYLRTNFYMSQVTGITLEILIKNGTINHVKSIKKSLLLLLGAKMPFIRIPGCVARIYVPHSTGPKKHTIAKTAFLPVLQR